MLLDLSEIVTREGMRVGLDLDQPNVEDPDLNFAEPLKGHLDFENSGDLISFHGRIDSTLIVPCSRCLTEVRMPVRLDVEEHFPVDQVLHPNKPPAEGEEVDIEVSSVVYLDQGKPILDLDELLRQLIVADMPIQTLCADACAGLCPHCGVNRNEQPCRCDEEQQNTPLAGLGALLAERENGEGSP
jgi:uncharacterized protein